jgi:hypothetical protein
MLIGQRVYGEVVARALADPTFRAVLEADPHVTLAAAGLPIPPDARVIVLDAAPTGDLEPGVIPFVLQAPDDTLSLEDLAAVAGGGDTLCLSTVPSCYFTFSSFDGQTVDPGH